MATEKVFSDYELDQMSVKFHGDTAASYKSMNCVGSLEEEMVSKTITKSCRGVVTKTRSRGDGTGTLKVAAHVPWGIFTNAYGMELDDLKEGVKAYGRNSIHKPFSITMHVMDEDRVEKLKAYPNCVITTGVVRKIENGAEEVAQMELEISVMPDDYGNGMYEALVDELDDETIKTTWMTAFTSEMVQIAKA